MHPIIPSVLASLGTSTAAAKTLSTTTPSRYNSGEALNPLGQAMYDRIEDLTGRTDKVKVNPIPNTPSFAESFIDPSAGASNTAYYRKDKPGAPAVGYEVKYNPNIDRSFLAHELGHIASAQTKPGHTVRRMRDNPKLQRAVGLAMTFAPFIHGAVTPGDDDLGVAIAGNLALAAPTVIDEALATKNGLALMKSADMRASLGQRGRLAGGLLSYALTPAVSAVIGNSLGNFADDYIAGPGQTAGTLEL